MSHHSRSSISEHDLSVEKTDKTGIDEINAQESYNEELHEAFEPPFEVDVEAAGNGNGGNSLEKVASAKPSINNIKSVPNGGPRAWLQVLGTFLIFFNTWGIINTFGAYQTYYETGLLSFESPSNISWIGSLQATLLLLVGMLTGPVYDAGYVRSLILVGSVLIVIGQILLSLCTTYWQVILAQALCIGIGAGCLFVPGVAILSTYFSTKLATAVGIAASGSSLGGVIYPIVFHRLQPQIGFGWATRVLGFMMLGTLAVPNLVMKVRVLPASRRKFLDLAAFTEPPYSLFVFGTTLGFVGLYAPFFYVQSYAQDTGLADANLSFYLLAILNSASIFGRIIPNFIADRTGPLNMIIPCSFATGICCLVLIPTRSIAPVIVITALYGFFSGTFVSIPPAIFVSITSNRAMIGTRIGMGFAVISIGLLIGTPICGAILNATGSYTYVWLFGGLLTISGSVLILFARVARGGWKIMRKV